MTIYQIAVFLHVLGALGMFAALGIEWVAVGPLRGAAEAEQARPWIRVLAAAGRVGGSAAGTLLVTGVYMSASAWGHQAWIGLSLLSLVFLAILAGGVTGRRIGAIARGLERNPSGDGALLLRLKEPALVVSLRLRTAVATGIVFLMTVKPSPGLALAAIGAAAVLGLAWSAPALGRGRSPRVEPAA